MAEPLPNLPAPQQPSEVVSKEVAEFLFGVTESRAVRDLVALLRTLRSHLSSCPCSKCKS